MHLIMVNLIQRSPTLIVCSSHNITNWTAYHIFSCTVKNLRFTHQYILIVHSEVSFGVLTRVHLSQVENPWNFYQIYNLNWKVNEDKLHCNDFQYLYKDFSRVAKYHLKMHFLHWVSFLNLSRWFLGPMWEIPSWNNMQNLHAYTGCDDLALVKIGIRWGLLIKIGWTNEHFR